MKGSKMSTSGDKISIFTIDLEDWFHVNDSTWVEPSQWESLDGRVQATTHYLLDELKKYQLKATFFVMGWIAERYPTLVRFIHDAGHDIGYHSYYHMRPFKQKPEEFEEDLVKGLSILKNVIGKQVRFYRAPNFSLNQESIHIVDILIKHGIEVSSSTKAHRRFDSFRIPNKPFVWQSKTGTLLEFPLNRKATMGIRLVYTGSGYFRLLPLELVNYLIRESHYNIIYFHPNDFDPNLPKPRALGFIRNFLNSVGTKSAKIKLTKLLKQMSFICISEAVLRIEKQNSAVTLENIVV